MSSQLGSHSLRVQPTLSASLCRPSILAVQHLIMARKMHRCRTCASNRKVHNRSSMQGGIVARLELSHAGARSTSWDEHAWV